MKPSTRQWIAIAVLGAMAGTLAGCGGGGGGGGVFIPPVGSAPPQTPPATTPPAGDDGDAFIAYVKGLLAQLLDTAEPFDVGAFDPPPTSETREPLSTE
ncbi:hypothetical protein [Variovorax sp. JS1663]|uniref:hypothetical protein n=1 Tax=Variovorax sp. JS1663 TaxID=1851577 RepID=UPI000B687A30|nr:hypothetical protein [Variovorax sp. JS1663]OUM02989.1 hypothetical protein A8M77_08590 [Variovorax sp. JS1663]